MWESPQCRAQEKLSGRDCDSHVPREGQLCLQPWVVSGRVLSYGGTPLTYTGRDGVTGSGQFTSAGSGFSAILLSCLL